MCHYIYNVTLKNNYRMPSWCLRQTLRFTVLGAFAIKSLAWVAKEKRHPLISSYFKLHLNVHSWWRLVVMDGFFRMYCVLRPRTGVSISYVQLTTTILRRYCMWRNFSIVQRMYRNIWCLSRLANCRYASYFQFQLSLLIPMLFARSV